MQHPNLYIIAGPNGAGKTTAAYNLLPEVLHCPNFVNADGDAILVATHTKIIGKIQIYEPEMWNQLLLKI